MPQTNTQAPARSRRRPLTTRIVIGAGIPTGVALFALGLWLDSIAWWSRHNYFLNIFSGFTGVCFGIPFALVGLDYLTRKQEEHRETEQARARASLFVASLLEVFNGLTLDEVSGKVRALLNESIAIRAVRGDDQSREDRELSLLAAFDELLPAPGGQPRTRWSSFRRQSNETDHMGRWRTEVERSWTRLDNVRAAVADDWIDKATDVAAHQAVGQLLRDGRSPWKANRDQESATAMRYFLRDLNALCQAAKALEAHTR
ncbi:hypothetical protein DI272_18765 [Streptomyces sp. Act143]|uniref:hypothetical protein n=1 Tax=Streptomyces sp. Act143 TaxID=2200760 RepID=UPI000D67D92A|nr:hypothetical protein [Streptomyces sp. Act143]PWI15978.1 hypothetical protein DI272_18765 [Streptomyces sp. Act143]